jgi:hypothetical protein
MLSLNRIGHISARQHMAVNMVLLSWFQGGKFDMLLFIFASSMILNDLKKSLTFLLYA